MPEVLITPLGRRLAYERHIGRASGPGIVFLGGFKSDMQGSKAQFLDEWARKQDRSFLRFDYSGHGQSSEAFEAGCIGDWAADARAVIETLTTGPQILIGSSMGGWISLLMARSIPERIAGLVGIAAAPDFTTSTWEGLSAAQQDEVRTMGKVALPSDYGAPYVFTRRLFEDGATQRIFDQPLTLPFPARFLQGTADADVPQEVALRILSHAHGPDIRLTLVKGADHRFSAPDELALIAAAARDILERL